MPAHLIAEEGPLRGLVLNLEEGEDWLIGRDPDVSDFVIEDSTVSRKHARLTKTPQGIFIQNLSTVNPILINGQEQEERILLNEGDRVQIGQQVFLYSEQELPDVGHRPKKKTSGGYDAIFGDLEEPPPPSREESLSEEEETREEERPKTPHATGESSYDTIFEDVEGPAELPFNLLQPAPLILKVIAGPNAGAEIGIEKGREYTIGKDPNLCDVVFQDLSVSRSHARLSVSADGILELEDLGSKNGTVVNGVPISEKKMITPQDLIALGTTVFLVIDREAPQETIYSPMIPVYEAAKTAPLPEEEKEEIAALIKQEQPDWKRKPIPQRHLIFAASFVAIFFIAFISFFSLFRSERIEVAHKEPASRIKEGLSKFPDVQFSFNPATGKLFLVGHVLTGVDYQEMAYRISEIDIIRSVENNVVIDELVWKSENDVLANNPAWRSVSIHSKEPGKFYVNGYVQSNQDAAVLSEFLTVNFPYLDRLQNNVVVEENLTAEIQSLLIMRGFGGVSFQLANGDLILTGGYNSKMKSEYEKTVKDLNSLQGIARIQDFTVAGAAATAGVDLTSQYQIGGYSLQGGKGFSIMLNGKIFEVGDTVDGMQITSMDAKTILLEKDGLKYKIDYR